MKMSSTVAYVTATNACLRNVNADILWAPETRHWPIFECDISDSS
jgi:hypothetical protein